MGIDFTIVPGHGPKILKSVRSVDDIRSLSAIVDPERQVPFLKPTLQVKQCHVCIYNIGLSDIIIVSYCRRYGRRQKAAPRS